MEINYEESFNSTLGEVVQQSLDKGVADTRTVLKLATIIEVLLTSLERVDASIPYERLYKEAIR